MAKKKDSKVSFSKVDKFLKQCEDTCSVTMSIGDETLSFDVKKYLDLVTFSAMVNAAVDAVFSVDHITGDVDYDASLEDIVKADAVLIYLTNFKDEMSFERVSALVYNSTLMHEIYAVWSPCQRKSFDDSFEKQVAHRREMLVAGERKKLKDLSNKLDAAIEALEAMTQTFSGIDQEQMANAISAMANISSEELIDGAIRANNPELKVIK